MSKTFQQLADEAMAQASAISPQDALLELQQNTDALLVDVRDESEAVILANRICSARYSKEMTITITPMVSKIAEIASQFMSISPAI